MKTKIKGFTLIELIVFILVIGIAATAIFASFSTALRQAPNASNQEIANQLAQGRMDIILGQKALVGFTSFSDPCPGASICSANLSVNNYSVNSIISSTTLNGDSNYKIITVTASGPNNTQAILTTLVAP